MVCKTMLYQQREMGFWEGIEAISAPAEIQKKRAKEFEAWFKEYKPEIGKVFFDKIYNLPRNKIPKDMRMLLKRDFTISNVKKMGEYWWAIKILDIWKKCAKAAGEPLPEKLYESSDAAIQEAKKFDAWLQDHKHDFRKIVTAYQTKFNKFSVPKIQDTRFSKFWRMAFGMKDIQALGAFYKAAKRLSLWQQWADMIGVPSGLSNSYSSREDLISNVEQFDTWFLSQFEERKICFEIFKKMKSHIESQNPIFIPINLRMRLGEFKFMERQAAFQNVYYLHKFIEALKIFVKWKAHATHINTPMGFTCEGPFLSSDDFIKNAKNYPEWLRCVLSNNTALPQPPRTRPKPEPKPKRLKQDLRELNRF